MHARRVAGRRAGAAGVGVGHRDHLGPPDLGAEDADVAGAHHARADDAHPHPRHGVSAPVRYVRWVRLCSS